MAVQSIFKLWKYVIFVGVIFFMHHDIKAQDKKISVQGYGELYYSYDFARPQNHQKPSFVYNHKRHNELNANLLLVKVTYNEHNLRANLGVMAGNYAQYNMSAEPTWGQFIYEANMGVKLSKQKNIWLDAGIMPSHIGFESAIAADCWTLTRSLVAENSPYYETGLKIGYTSPNQKLNLGLMALNGWQRIQRPEGIQKPSFGMQVNYKPSSRLLFNYSNFVGSDKADFLNSWRIYHNIYAIYDAPKWGFIAGFDLGSDKYNVNKYGYWLTPVLISRLNISEKIKVAVRTEYFNDKNQIIIADTPQLWGLSTNFDYQIHQKCLWRLEAKQLWAKGNVFSNNSNQNTTLTTALIFRL